MNEYDDNLSDEIDFTKTKRGKGKNSHKRWSFFIIEGIIVLVAIVAGGRFLFKDNAEVSHLQATIDAQQSIQVTDSNGNWVSPTQSSGSVLSASQLFDRAMDEAEDYQYQDAIRSLDFAIELDPTYAEAYFERGELHYETEIYSQAIKDYGQAIEHGYDDVITAYYSRGRSHIQWYDYTKAIRDFNSVIERDPDYTNAYYWRGRSYIDSFEYQRGIDDILLSIDMGYTELPFAYFFVGKAYDDMDNYDKAIEYYTLSLEAGEDDCERYLCWIDYNNRGTSYHWSGQYELAVQDYTKSIQVNPDEYPLALKNRGDAYEALFEITQALSDWNTMFQLIEGDVSTRTLSADSNVLSATIERDDSQVFVNFDGQAGDSITLNLTVSDDSELDAMILLRDSNGSPLAYSADGDTVNAQLSNIVLPTDGTYTLVVASNLADSSGDFTLRLE